jgi:hypothetical protein
VEMGVVGGDTEQVQDNGEPVAAFLGAPSRLKLRVSSPQWVNDLARKDSLSTPSNEYRSTNCLVSTANLMRASTFATMAGNSALPPPPPIEMTVFRCGCSRFSLASAFRQPFSPSTSICVSAYSSSNCGETPISCSGSLCVDFSWPWPSVTYTECSVLVDSTIMLAIEPDARSEDEDKE